MVSAPPQLVTIPISLPTGTYLLGYSAYLMDGGNGTDQAGCYFHRQLRSELDLRRFHEDADLPVQWAGRLGQRPEHWPGVTLELVCYGAVPFTTPANNPIQITATRTHLVSGGSIG